ncbi:hypothetical protein OQJ18_12795 [Fluoribacter dumoffii]|uniref:Uncharacterized protein n=1 Tax=Fluoribacter dumoffii TaxID=463 RepID=A0A377GEW7_9GAMM|nr:hypothetical protein [Fluoribacter dumoffii]KTC91406.1 hypothetical protein Ldum_2474 [Fluoribacter dumoffii NY 23]MCW8387464.1 hypothetical protein [Fluoribacter dumoffii]MCW8417028.1 hypothetical protein [Fluoribacter dumoffii]MCW8455132.1 hypothetical protein [Fluoribacter dumoffii]MCW8460791.1 hypothetical protein [Fluoribacter dumoffii]
MFARMMMRPSSSRFFSSSTRDISLMRIGRMAPETTIDILAQELKAELKEKGIAQLQKNLEEEKKILKELQATHKESLERIKEICVTPAQDRFAQGYSIGGLFWEQKQKEMKRVATKELLEIREETIDWLKNRQELYNQFKNDAAENSQFIPKI